MPVYQSLHRLEEEGGEANRAEGPGLSVIVLEGFREEDTFGLEPKIWCVANSVAGLVDANQAS